MMLRALDYCPPVDVNYLDYARAVARADRTAYPIDQMGYRTKWEAIMRKRKVIPKTGSWQVDLKIRNSDLRGLDMAKIAASNTDAGDFLNANRGVLKIPPLANIEVINLYRTQKVSSDDFRVPQEIIIEFIWASDLKLADKKFGPLQGHVPAAVVRRHARVQPRRQPAPLRAEGGRRRPPQGVDQVRPVLAR